VHHAQSLATLKLQEEVPQDVVPGEAPKMRSCKPSNTFISYCCQSFACNSKERCCVCCKTEMESRTRKCLPTARPTMMHWQPTNQPTNQPANQQTNQQIGRSLAAAVEALNMLPGLFVTPGPSRHLMPRTPRWRKLTHKSHVHHILVMW